MLMGLLPATHERGKRSPLARRDDGAAVQSQPVHFNFSGFTANSSLASAEIAQLCGRDFLRHTDGQSRNARRPRSEQGAFRQISPRRNESAPGEVFLWGHQADRRPAVKLSPKEASKGVYCGERAFARPKTGEELTARLKIYSKGERTGDALGIATLPGAAARAPIK